MTDTCVRLLIVEDNPADLRLVQFALEDMEGLAVEITSVETLADAEASLAMHPFDLILLDLHLPDSQGLATLQSVAAAAPGLPIIVFTDRVLENTGLESLRSGADDFLRKDEIGGGALVRSIRYALERQRRSRHDHFLASVIGAIGGALDAEAALRTLAHLAVPGLADWCLVELVEPTQEVRVVEIVASDARKQGLLRAKLSSYPHTTNGGRHPVDQVLRTGEPHLLASVSDEELQRIAYDAQHLALLRELAPRSMMILPLAVGGRVLGAVTLTTSESGRVYDATELRLAAQIAEPVATIIENARRVRDVEEARRRAERAVDRAEHMERVTSALAAASTPQQVGAAMMTEGMGLAGACAGALLVHRDESGVLHLLRSAGLPETELPLWSQLSMEQTSPVADALRSGVASVVRDRAELVRRYPAFAESAGDVVEDGLLVLPLVAGERRLGAIVFLLDHPAALSPGDVALLEECAAHCAVALDRAFLFEREQRALSEAQRASRLKDEVLGVVAHDLRNPVSAIGMYASLLNQSDAAVEKRQSWARSIHKLTEQMQRLIQDLLDVTRLESGTLVVEPIPVKAAVLLHDALALMEPVAAAAGVRLRLELEHALPDVRADLDRVRQVFSNLIGNAIRFSPTGGEVRLRAEALGGEVLFLVSDDGPGIPLEHRPHIFDRLWQGNHEPGGGAGLGLAIAKGIVERHGGRIGVESRPGAGSTFFFSLPCAAVNAENPGASPEPQEASPSPASEPVIGPPLAPAARIRVLLVDDHPLVRRGVRDRLESTGRYTVVGEAGTGEEAIRLARLSRPQIVLMDLHLPGLSGIEATRRITAEIPHLPVLALSGESEADVLLEVLEAGGSGFVRKSTAEHDLLPAIETVLQGEVFLYPTGNKLLLGEFLLTAADAASNPTSVLSEHERQVLAMAAEGFSSAEIGKKLFLSPQTVDSYRSRAMRKLGISGRPALVRFAVRTGLLTAPG
jgi:DNA-binding NarL/FixJ family response regulator/signal transduction histidine kinase